MEPVIIERCIKNAGVFKGARTYRLVLNEKGLYILELGKAMGQTNKGNAISDAILNSIEKKRESEMAETAQRLEAEDPSRLVDGKKNFHVKKEDVRSVELKHADHAPKLSIKSGTVNITLHMDPYYKNEAQAIAAFLGE